MARVLSAVDYTACSPPSTIPRVAMSIRALAVVLVWATAAGRDAGRTAASKREDELAILACAATTG